MRTLITLLASLALAQQPPSEAPPTGVLTGRVVNALTGEGVKKAMVELRFLGMPPRGQMPATTTVTTDSTGHFRATDLADGKYMVRASHPGHPVPRQTLPRNDQIEATVGGPNPTKDLVASLLPGGAIAGHLADLDGQPLSGYVEVIERSASNPSPPYATVNGGRIDEEGTFRIANLPPGRYYLRVRSNPGFVQPHGLMTDAELEKRPKLDYVAQFFPSGLSIDSAETLTVTAGGVLQGVEMKIAPTPTVSIRGKLNFASAAGATPERTMIMLMPVATEAVTNNAFATTSAGRDGTFTLRTIPKGSYIIKVSSDAGERGYYAQQPVHVGGEPISGLEIAVRESVDVPLTLTVESTTQSGNQPAPRLDRIMIQPASFGAGTIIPRVKKLEDGKFEIQKLTPGKYRLSPNTSGYIKSIKWGDRETTGGLLEVTGAESGSIQLTLSPNFARLNGSVQDYRPGSKLVVALLPEDDERVDYSTIVSGMVTPSGQIQAQGAPGTYFAICMEGAGMQQVLHPAVRAWAKQHGTRITLDAAAPATAILPIAKRETLEQILDEYAAKSSR